MGDDVLARDHRAGRGARSPSAGSQASISIPRPSIVGAIPQTSGATARHARQSASGHRPSRPADAEDRAGDILAKDDHPLDPAQRITHQIA